MTLNAKIGVFK